MTPAGFPIDANLGHAPAEAMQRAGLETVHVATWQDGRYRQVDDTMLLQAARSAGRVLVPLDAATLPALAWSWSASDPSLQHAGRLVLSSRIAQSSVSARLAAVLAAVDRVAGRSWDGLVVYAQRAPR